MYIIIYKFKLELSLNKPLAINIIFYPNKEQEELRVLKQEKKEELENKNKRLDEKEKQILELAVENTNLNYFGVARA